ncbi:MAG: hypothetical protein V7K86_13460 [Nostoc sp.]
MYYYIQARTAIFIQNLRLFGFLTSDRTKIWLTPTTKFPVSI